MGHRGYVKMTVDHLSMVVCTSNTGNKSSMSHIVATTTSQAMSSSNLTPLQQQALIRTMFVMRSTLKETAHLIQITAWSFDLTPPWLSTQKTLGVPALTSEMLWRCVKEEASLCQYQVTNLAVQLAESNPPTFLLSWLPRQLVSLQLFKITLQADDN